MRTRPQKAGGDVQHGSEPASGAIVSMVASEAEDLAGLSATASFPLRAAAAS
jgi:hypothetical protein